MAPVLDAAAASGGAFGVVFAGGSVGIIDAIAGGGAGGLGAHFAVGGTIGVIVAGIDADVLIVAGLAIVAVEVVFAVLTTAVDAPVVAPIVATVPMCFALPYRALIAHAETIIAVRIVVALHAGAAVAVIVAAFVVGGAALSIVVDAGIVGGADHISVAIAVEDTLHAIAGRRADLGVDTLRFVEALHALAIRRATLRGVIAVIIVEAFALDAL